MRILTRKRAAGAVLGLMIAIAPLPSAPASAASIDEVASLEPGRFLWQPHRAERGDIEMVISLPLQMAYVYRGGTLIGVSSVSTGRPGYETPAGRFRILQKRRHHRSNRYSNAPMPFMQRLTWSGYAIHGGQLPGYPASHGCIRLPQAFARHLYAATDLGARVHITYDMPPSADVALAMARGEAAYTGMGGPDPDE